MERIGHLARAVVIADGQVVVGVVTRDGVAPLRGPGSISELLQMDLGDIEIEMSHLDPAIPFQALLPLPPIDGAMEVWAAGVTYLASKEARVEESDDREVYRRVYDAKRPELFFKSPPWRVVTDGEPIGVRGDSENNVPEPEVGLVLTGSGELFGFTIVDDVSSRSIEGANPLYLPQAKVFDGCCALGPSIAPRWLVPKPSAMEIRMTIRRSSDVVFFGESSTGRMKRSFDEHPTSDPDLLRQVRGLLGPRLAFRILVVRAGLRDRGAGRGRHPRIRLPDRGPGLSAAAAGCGRAPPA